MTNAVRSLADFGAKIMNNVENTLSGGKQTSNTLFSQIADPFRKARQNYAAGAGVSPADMLDPNSKLHKQDTPQTIQKKKDDAAAAAQYQKDLLMPPNLSGANLGAQQTADRLRRRRGILANIYAGSNGGGATVATKTLLGS